MGVRQVELCANLQMALEAGFRRFARIDDRTGSTASRDVLASGAVAGFATDVLGVLALGLQPGVGGSREVTCDRFVTLLTGGTARIGCTRNARGSHDGPRQRSARDHRDSKRCATGGEEYCFPSSALKPTG